MPTASASRGKAGGGRLPNLLSLQLPEDAVDLAYMAGILDGEGSISTLNGNRHKAKARVSGIKRQRRWVVCITSTHQPLIEWLSAFGGTVHLGSENALATLPCWVWKVAAWRDALHLLEKIGRAS